MEFKQCSFNGKIYETLDDVRDVFLLNKSDAEIQACHRFLKLLAVCHSVVIDYDSKTGKESMQASSPDELALV
jgi:magnesium-transporting ATPase (P-type)